MLATWGQNDHRYTSGWLNLKRAQILEYEGFLNPSDSEANNVNNLERKLTRQSVQFPILSHSKKFSKSDKLLPFELPELRILGLQIANTSPGATGLIPLVWGKVKQINSLWDWNEWVPQGQTGKNGDERGAKGDATLYWWTGLSEGLGLSPERKVGSKTRKEPSKRWKDAKTDSWACSWVRDLSR